MGLVVVDNRLNEDLLDFFLDSALGDGIFPGIFDKDILNVEVNYAHLFGGQSTGLADAEFSHFTHRLTAAEVAYKDLVFGVHVDDRVGK